MPTTLKTRMTTKTVSKTPLTDVLGADWSGSDRSRLRGDGCIDAVEDDDDDQDGVLDPLDRCPNTDASEQVSSNGCSQYQLDDDNDGVVNAFDFCLSSPLDSTVDERLQYRRRIIFR